VTTELLGFAAAGIGDEETLIVLNEQFLELSLAGLIMVLLVEGNNGLGDGLTDGHNLGGGTTTTDSAADVEVLEAVGTEEEDWLPNLKAEGGGFQKVKGLSVNFNEASVGSCVGNSGGILLSAEALNLFCFTHFVLMDSVLEAKDQAK